MSIGTKNDLTAKKLIEVVVRWQDRVINTYHFSEYRIFKLGLGADISVPMGCAPNDWPVLVLTQGVIINTNADMRIEVENNTQNVSSSYGRHELARTEVCTVHLLNNIRLIIRFVPSPPPVIIDPNLLLNPAARFAVITSVITSVIASLVVLWSTPESLEEVKAETARVIEVHFKRRGVKPSAGQASDASSANNANAEVAKAANQLSQVKKSGLLAAFGAGSTKNKLDKVNNESTQLIGAGENANGSAGARTSGQGNNVNFKDTGASGVGTATQGMSGGIKTKGRSSGMAGYGNESSLGNKDSVQLTAGGDGEAFIGSIDREAVRRAVRSALTQIKSCYERQYRLNSNLEGKVVIQWEIHPNGVAKNAQVVRAKSTINNSAVEECVKLKILALKYPDPPAGVAAEVTYPFIFVADKFTQGEEK